jgi:hypothetical protein
MKCYQLGENCMRSFTACKYNQAKEDEMDRAYSMHWVVGMHIELWWESQKKDPTQKT